MLPKIWMECFLDQARGRPVLGQMRPVRNRSPTFVNLKMRLPARQAAMRFIPAGASSARSRNVAREKIPAPRSAFRAHGPRSKLTGPGKRSAPSGRPSVIYSGQIPAPTSRRRGSRAYERRTDRNTRDRNSRRRQGNTHEVADLAKVLHPIAGRPMLDYPLSTAEALANPSGSSLVVGRDAETRCASVSTVARIFVIQAAATRHRSRRSDRPRLPRGFPRRRARSATAIRRC